MAVHHACGRIGRLILWLAFTGERILERILPHRLHGRWFDALRGYVYFPTERCHRHRRGERCPYIPD